MRFCFWVSKEKSPSTGFPTVYVEVGGREFIIVQAKFISYQPVSDAINIIFLFMELSFRTKSQSV